MPCTHYSGPDKWVIVCSRGRRAELCQAPGCHAAHTRLCDWPLKAGGTCSRRICDGHARPVRAADGSLVDLCPAHFRQWDADGRPPISPADNAKEAP